MLWSLVVSGILAISCAALFIRLTHAPTLAIAAYRTALATLVMLPYAAYRDHRSPQTWSRRVAGQTSLAGLFLALHFVFWIQSLQMTSVASSVVLVSATPFFVALFSLIILREPLHRWLWMGIFCTVAGSIVIAGTDVTFSRENLKGDLLAVLGALMAAGYLLTGRVVQRHLCLAAYTAGAYGAAAAVLGVACLGTKTPLHGFSTQTYLMLVLLAMIPQLIGHTIFNWTLKFLPPTLVSLLILGEPIGATLLAYLLLGERVAPAKLMGLITVGLGIAMASMPAPSQLDLQDPATTPPDTGIKVDNPGENQ
jgi:drug/metabolite transporter (DMT)-like permease